MSGRPLILVVDDDADLRDALGEILLDDGYRVAAAANGREALDLLHAGLRPALILLDLRMPVCSGWQFREEQLGDPSLASIPVMVISADLHAYREVPALRVLEWLPKPLDLGRLFAAIERCVPSPGPSP